VLAPTTKTAAAPSQPHSRFDYAALSPELRAQFDADPAAQMTLRNRALDLDAVSPEGEQPANVAAFFDIDGTLIKGSIAGHLFSQGVVEGLASRWMYVVFFFFFLLYKLNLIPRQRMYRWGFGLSSGISLSESAEFVRRCISGRISRSVYVGARAFVDIHRALGHRVVAVTGAPDYAAAQVAHALGFDDVLATPTPIEGEQLGGEIEGPICYAEGKVPYVRAYAVRHGIDLTRSYVYSDSRSDLPMLALVGHPFCVNPQALLRFAAWRRGWDVLLLRRIGEL
jgi:HAD superfamily hydrolase (TIGR01490 family)